jgi:hypothetical protein
VGLLDKVGRFLQPEFLSRCEAFQDRDRAYEHNAY